MLRFFAQTHSPLLIFGVKCNPYAAIILVRYRRKGSGNESDQIRVDVRRTPRDTLTITDNRNGRQYEIPIKNDTIRAIDLRKIKIEEPDFGMMSYDPAFTNTASCTSKITFIDGDKGILRYRGYSIEELAEKSTYPETAYLILHGELPTQPQLNDWNYHITHHTFIHESIKKFLDGFHYDAHPMGMLISTVAALSTFYPDAKDIFNADSRRKQTYRLIGKMPTLAAFAYRHSLGMPFVYPDNDLSYCRQFPEHAVPHHRAEVSPESDSRARARHPVHPARRPRAKLLVDRHARRRQLARRSVFGDRRGHRRALRPAPRRRQRASAAHAGRDRLDQQCARLREKREGRRKVLMGFGHRVYKNYDPRARIVKRIAYEVFDVMGRNPLIDIALECERIALEDDYFVTRRLYPNVDFYTGLIYQSMGFPVTMFPVLFAIPRTSGWIAQWEEMLLDPEQKISRPRQVYTGYDLRSYIPPDHRS